MSQTIMEVRDLRKWYPVRRSLVSGARSYVRALDGVSIQVGNGEVLGLAGESGSGKSTLGEILVGLQQPTAGEVRFLGRRLEHARRATQFHREVQIIFQDPYATLNPRFTVFRSVAEPLIIARVRNPREVRRRAVEALELAELRPGESYLDAYPHQLSGGQRQRVAIARAIVVRPRFIVADEPVSMLDVSVRSGVLNLLRELRKTMGLAMLFISHDLSTIKYLCDRTAIMYLGRVMEVGPTDDLVFKPVHPYTRALMAAVPVPDPDAGRKRVRIEGEVPDPIDLPPGCRFWPRCPRRLPRCQEREPELATVSKSGRQVACHLVA